MLSLDMVKQAQYQLEATRSDMERQYMLRATTSWLRHSWPDYCRSTVSEKSDLWPYDLWPPVHSLTWSFHDLRGLRLRQLPFTLPWSMIFGSISWRQTWPKYDSLRRLTVDSKKLLTHFLSPLISSVFADLWNRALSLHKKLDLPASTVSYCVHSEQESGSAAYYLHSLCS